MGDSSGGAQRGKGNPIPRAPLMARTGALRSRHQRAVSLEQGAWSFPRCRALPEEGLSFSLPPAHLDSTLQSVCSVPRICTTF